MLRGKRNLDWFFQNRKWISLKDRSVQVGYALRPLPEGESPIQFLLVATKRDMKRAHDRNRAKRWLRAAILETPDFGDLEHQLPPLQLILMLRVAVHPDRIEYSAVRSAVTEASKKLLGVVQKLGSAGESNRSASDS
jgi:ribonuclease P protein component